MEPLHLLEAVAAMIATAVGATWVLHSALSDIKGAVEVHVARDEEVHKSHDARIIKLETRRGTRR